MSRRVRVWVAVGVALCAVVGMMIAITSTLLATERAAAEATAHAVTEERVRLALWRLDSTVPGRISQEMARVALLAESPDPAPELPNTPEVRGRFLRSANGSLRWLTAPESPVLDSVTLALKSEGFEDTLGAPSGFRAPPLSVAETNTKQTKSGYYAASQQSRNSQEWQKRASSARDNMNSIATVQQQQSAALLNNLNSLGSKVSKLSKSGNRNGEVNSVGSLAGLPFSATDDSELYRELEKAIEDEQASLASAQLGPVTPIWVGDELVLARRVRRGESVEIHGAWIDWPKLRDDLLVEVADLLPSPALTPAPTPSTADTARLLATLPVRLDHGALPPPPSDAFTPVRASIIGGWLVVLIGTGTVVVLLLWSMALSERRAAFVSTVTHELRTPLTTFRMYTEMLGEKMVESKRDRYIATLRTEAERLGHLVENVLSYAKIESDKAERTRETVSVQSLLEHVAPALRSRCEASGTELEVVPDEATLNRTVQVDTSAIEQILLNLIDNAAKYAPSAQGPTRMVVETLLDGRQLRIAVRDFGPGIPAGERRKIFEPFSKAKRDEAGTKPGVGLGLALCRRLARAHGGDLSVEDAKPGARFVLTLASQPS
ncbi:MAG: sensor histidine kinase [Nannocystales bacterium]